MQGGPIYALAATIAFAAVCAVVIGIVPAAVLNVKTPVAVTGAGLSPLAGTATGQATVYSFGALFGWAWQVVDGALYLNELGWQSDFARVAVVTSNNVDSVFVVDADYRTSALYSTAGTPAFHGYYRLQMYWFVTPNVTGRVSVVISLPDDFLSPAVVDNGQTLNANAAHFGVCGIADGATGTPLTSASYLITREAGFIGYPGPTLYMSVLYPTYESGILSISCDANIITPQ